MRKENERQWWTTEGACRAKRTGSNAPGHGLGLGLFTLKEAVEQYMAIPSESFDPRGSSTD